MIRSLPRLSLALALVLFAGACRHPGMMFLCLSVTRGGEPLAEVWFDASDSSDASATFLPQCCARPTCQSRPLGPRDHLAHAALHGLCL